MSLTKEERDYLLDNIDKEDIKTSICYKETDSNFKFVSTPDKMKANFIAFEGIDGSGKSSVLRAIQEDPEFSNIIRSSAEPQRKDFGAVVRDYLNTHQMSNRGLVLAIAADRDSHLREIDDLISQGFLCISDRYLMSSYAYQGLDAMIVNNCFPRAEYTFYFDLPVDVALQRAKPREVGKQDQGLANLFENKEKLIKTQAYYEDLIKIGVFNTVRINSNRPFEEVVDEVKQRLRLMYPKFFKE